MATFTNGGTVWAGFVGPGESACVASATVSWDDNLVVSISNEKYSYSSGLSVSFSCKWRVKLRSGGDPLAGTDQGVNYFSATEDASYVFQACASGPYAWGNSQIEEGEEGSSYFTVTRGSGGGDEPDIPDIPDMPDSYVIQYHANGGVGAPSAQYKTEGSSVYLSNIRPTKTSTVSGSYTIMFDAGFGNCSTQTLNANITKSYTFAHWNTSQNGTGTRYMPGALYSYDGDLTLYAIYLETEETTSISLPSASRDGYDFLGWATSPDAASGMVGEYTPNAPTKDIKLYAIWGAKGFIYLYDGSKFNPYQVFIYNGSSWSMYCPYIYDNEWSMCS